MNHNELIKKLEELDACQPALDWVKFHPDLTIRELWDKCEHGDWMWWLLRKTKLPTKKESIAFAEWCAKQVKKYVAAYAYAAYNAAYAYAATAAAYNATAAATAAYAATVAAYNAATAAAATATYDAAAAYAAERKTQADYIRQHFTCPL